MTEREIVERMLSLERRIKDLERRPGPGVWVDYSTTSTITGWSAYTNRYIYYMRTGNLIFVTFLIGGTSGSTEAKFTLPFTAATNPNYRFLIRAQDNGGAYVLGLAFLSAASNLVTTYKDLQGAVFTIGNTKYIAGQFCYAV